MEVEGKGRVWSEEEFREELRRFKSKCWVQSSSEGWK